MNYIKSISWLVGMSIASSILATPVFSQKKRSEKANNVKNIRYEVANRYFVKNSVPDGNFVYKLTNQVDFDKLFGAATVMGNAGKPTPIDFSKSVVLTVISEKSVFNTAILLERLIISPENKLNISYQIEKSKEASSMSTRVPLILIIDKKYDLDFTVSMEGEEVTYKLANRYFVKNNVENGLFYLTNVTTEEQFNSYFGAAAVMGEGGIPTQINFETEAIIGIIYPLTKSLPQLKIEQVIKKEGEIQILYSADIVDEGENWRELLILILDKNTEAKVIFTEIKR